MLYTFLLVLSTYFLNSLSDLEPSTFKNTPSTTILPKVTGKHYVGTKNFEIVDGSRVDILDGTKARTLVGQIWYPAKQSNDERVPYIDSRLVVHMKDISYMTLSDSMLQGLETVKTNSFLNALPVNSKIPVVFFIHGLGVPKEFYSIMYEDLASHGYAVIALDHPYGGMTILEDGSIISGEMDTITSYEPSEINFVMGEWSKDIAYVLEHFRDARTIWNEFFNGFLDFENIAVGGHSIGGNIALGLDKHIPNLKGAFNMDGGSFENVEDEGIGIKSLFLRSYPIYSDEELRKKGRTRESWSDVGNEMQKMYTNIYDKTAEPITSVQVKGTGHFSFSDAPFLLPYLITFFGGEILDELTTKQITHHFVLSFLDDVFERNELYESSEFLEYVLLENY